MRRAYCVALFLIALAVLGITPLASKMLATSSAQEHVLGTETGSRSFSLYELKAIVMETVHNISAITIPACLRQG